MKSQLKSCSSNLWRLLIILSIRRPRLAGWIIVFKSKLGTKLLMYNIVSLRYIDYLDDEFFRMFAVNGWGG